ncbi:MAG: sugar transferase [Candidatus Brocadiia bacterium]|jgi:lipopolysaccharide/colanic/teichoic acid biosynthesis glycosyltransferase|nr:sugar transferase [Candidatus Brocadiia bacterium]
MLQPAAPIRTRRKPLRRIVKRAFDIAFSSIAIVFAAPILALIYVAVRLTSGRPVAYKDYRCTVGGRRFAMLKFRTMVPDADEFRPDLAARNESEGPTFKVSNDPRTTRLGALLRKVSLDELPRLFNVLKGNMSLVGPRPLRMDEMQYHRAWRDQGLSAVPGVTGPWQVASDNTRFHTCFSEDAGYVQRNSFWRDVWILALVILKLGRHGPQTSPPTASGQGQPVQNSEPDEAPTLRRARVHPGAAPQAVVRPLSMASRPGRATP